MLYVLDREKKKVFMIDPREVEQWCQDTPVLMYAELTLGLRVQLMQAINQHIPGWNEDVWKWKFTRVTGLPTNVHK